MLGRLKIPKIRKIRPGQVLKPPKSPRSASEGSWRGRNFSGKNDEKIAKGRNGVTAGRTNPDYPLMLFG